MGVRTHFTRPDGRTCPGYLAEPPPAPIPAPGFVLLQEWWGLTPQIIGMADRLAAAGYRVLVPDLFRGKVATVADEAAHLMHALDFADAAEQDVQGAAQWLKERSGRCGVGGFCMGGALTLLAAVRTRGLDCGVCFYGVPPEGSVDYSKVAIPLQLHFGDQDTWCNPSVVDALQTELLRAPARFELYRYPADHAFMNEHRPEVYDQESAQLAWRRMLSFLERTLQG